MDLTGSSFDQISGGENWPSVRLDLIVKYLLFVAKNIVLAGVKSVTVHDPDTVKVDQLSSQV